MQAASLGIAPGRWLGPQPAPLGGGGGDAGQQQAAQQQQAADERPVYGLELTADQWDPLNLTVLKVLRGKVLRWARAGTRVGPTAHCLLAIGSPLLRINA